MRAATAATYEVAGSCLHLRIPPTQGRWLEGAHDPPLRVSAVQSGNWSGPVGSTRGQQPFREGLTVTEEQPAQWGCTPWYGRVEVECRARLDASSMFSAWMIGLEDQPERCGEICLVEVFGETVADGTVALGSGVHAFRDPRLREEFDAPTTSLDVAVPHRYAVEWQPGRVDFYLDGERHRTVLQAPEYPMELILGVFEFPERRRADQPPITPELVVHRVLVEPLPSPTGRGTRGHGRPLACPP